VVVDAEDLQCSTLNAIRNNDRGARNCHLARARHAVRVSKVWVFGKVAFDTIEDKCGNALCGVLSLPETLSD
jgi:hypothetical protein